jgi:hypothetical protein
MWHNYQKPGSCLKTKWREELWNVSKYNLLSCCKRMYTSFLAVLCIRPYACMHFIMDGLTLRVSLSPCLIKHHTLEIYGGLAVCPTDCLDGGGVSNQLNAPAPLLPGKELGHQLDMRLGGPHSGGEANGLCLPPLRSEPTFQCNQYTVHAQKELACHLLCK